MELYTNLIVLLLNTKLYNMFSNVDLTDKRNCQSKGKYMYKLVRELGFLYTSTYNIYRLEENQMSEQTKMSSFFYSFYNNVPC